MGASHSGWRPCGAPETSHSSKAKLWRNIRLVKPHIKTSVHGRKFHSRDFIKSRDCQRCSTISMGLRAKDMISVGAQANWDLLFQ